jgi:hypothetical protein
MRRTLTWTVIAAAVAAVVSCRAPQQPQPGASDPAAFLKEANDSLR